MCTGAVSGANDDTVADTFTVVGLHPAPVGVPFTVVHPSVFSIPLVALLNILLPVTPVDIILWSPVPTMLPALAHSVPSSARSVSALISSFPFKVQRIIFSPVVLSCRMPCTNMSRVLSLR